MIDIRSSEFAGVFLLAAGLVTLLGFVTAASLYPGYSVADQTISALGAADAPSEAATVFNLSMALAGLLAVGASFGLVRVTEGRLLAGVVGVTGVGGMVGIAVFPSQTGAPHLVAALIAFAGIGLSALVAASRFRGPIRGVSIVLGVGVLVTLVGFLVRGESNPLGIGGLERWVAYLGAVWVIAFGGFLLGRSGRRS